MTASIPGEAESADPGPLRVVAVGRVHPLISDPRKADVTFELSRGPNKFEVECWSRDDALADADSLDEGEAYITLPVDAGGLKEAVLNLDDILSQISTRAERLAATYQQTRDSFNDEMSGLTFGN